MQEAELRAVVLLHQLRDKLNIFIEEWKERMTATDDVLASIKTDMAALKAQASSNHTVLLTVSADLTQAIANGQAQGLTAAQLADFQAVDADLKTVASNMATDDTAAAASEPPAPLTPASLTGTPAPLPAATMPGVTPAAAVPVSGSNLAPGASPAAAAAVPMPGTTPAV